MNFRLAKHGWHLVQHHLPTKSGNMLVKQFITRKLALLKAERRDPQQWKDAEVAFVWAMPCGLTGGEVTARSPHCGPPDDETRERLDALDGCSATEILSTRTLQRTAFRKKRVHIFFA